MPRFAVLGCGSIGLRHLRNLQTLGHQDIIAFDPAQEVRKAVEAEFKISCSNHLDNVWAQTPDVVLVTAPSSFHIRLALAAAHHNCHIFIEKPISHNLDGVYDLLGEVRRRNLITMVGCNMRFHPGPAWIKRLIDEGAVGKLLAARVETGSYMPEWRPWLNYRTSYSANSQLGGGALLDCIHEIDLALWYFGPGRVMAAAVQRADTIGLDVEGLAELLVQHDNGVLASVHLNFVQRDYNRSCQIIGEKGTIRWNFASPVVEVRNSRTENTRYEIDSNWNTDRMYIDEMSYFIDCVEAGKETFSTAENGVSALRVVLAAKELAAKMGEGCRN